MITKRRLNKLVNDLGIICVMMLEVNGLEDFDYDLYPYPISQIEYEEIELEILTGYITAMTNYILHYAHKHEIYEVCEELNKIKAVLVSYNNVYSCMLPFTNRVDYYSQTEVVKKFKISVAKFKELIEINNLNAVQHELPMGTVLKPYSVTTMYVLKKDIDGLDLPLR